SPVVCSNNRPIPAASLSLSLPPAGRFARHQILISFSHRQLDSQTQHNTVVMSSRSIERPRAILEALVLPFAPSNNNNLSIRHAEQGSSITNPGRTFSFQSLGRCDRQDFLLVNQHDGISAKIRHYPCTCCRS